MPQIKIQLECPVFNSFRVQQVAGMFDVPLAEKLREEFSLDVPKLNFPWQIGVIVGPSGSGKTTLARQLFGSNFIEHVDWPKDRAVIDCFEFAHVGESLRDSQSRLGETRLRDGLHDGSIHHITGLLTAVGFSSPPSWVKPYHVLSGGERFRCDLARALAGTVNKAADGIGGAMRVDVQAAHSADTIRGFMNACDSPFRTPHSALPLVAFDEFTSVVDRNVARIGSATVAKQIRQGNIHCQFVAVTCHYDILEWLEPDWVIDMATRKFQRRLLQRPTIALELFRCKHAVWRLFARYHYLSGSLSKAARCYVALWQNVPVSFCATLPIVGRKNHWRISRIVTLPDYQGVGIGMRVAEAVADLHVAEGKRLNVTASHPGLIAHCRRSPKWRAVNVKKTGSRPQRNLGGYAGSMGRAVVSFEYQGAGVRRQDSVS